MNDASIKAQDESYWESRRAEVMLDANSTYLNNGSFGPVPKPVYAALANYRQRQAESPSDFFWRQMPPRLDEARRRLAHFLTVDEGGLLLQPNVTFSMNLAARALDLPSGSEILMTEHEYGACKFCWRQVASERGWTLREFQLPYLTEDPAEITAAFRVAIGPKTRVLFFSHVTSPTGLVLPAAELCAAARHEGILSIVDGAHAAGMLSVNLSAVDADFYGGNLHKWLLAPSGSAFLYVRKEWRRTLKPLVVSWGWDVPDRGLFDDSGWGGSFWARNLEFIGTVDRSPQMVTPEVIDYRDTFDEAAISARTRFLVDRSRAAFTDLGLKAGTPRSPELSGTLTAFEIPRIDAWKARSWIWKEHRIEVNFTEAAGKHFFRVSNAWFTLPSEIDRAASAMRHFRPGDLQ